MKVKKWNDLTVKDDYMFKRLMSCRDICIRLFNRERGYYMNLIIEMQKRERIGEKRGKKIGKEIGEKIGKEIGEKISVVNSIKSLMGSLNMSIEAVMNALNIPSEDRDLYSRLVSDPSFCEKYFKDASNFSK